jgi:hypothetical protein
VKSEEKFHSEENMDEYKLVSSHGEDMTEGEMSQEIPEQKISGTTVEFGPAMEWNVSAKGDRNNMGYQIDLPIYLCEGV